MANLQKVERINRIGEVKKKAKELYEAIRKVDRLKKELWKDLPPSVDLDLEETRGLMFKLSDYRFAIPITSISEVVRAAALTPTPESSDFILGMLNLHGNPLPVLDLHRLMDMESPPLDPSQAFVVVELGERMVGLRVDDVNNLISWRKGDLVSPGKFLPYMPNIKAVVVHHGVPIALLDVSELITRANVAVLLK